MIGVPNLSERLACILDGLCRVIAARAAGNPAAARLLAYAWGYLRRSATRLATVIARASAGAQASHPDARSARIRRGPRVPWPLPRARHWLHRLAPEAAGFGAQLATLLSEPEMAALLAASPQAGRLIRPLCRMLEIAPGAAALPQRPARLQRTKTKARRPAEKPSPPPPPESRTPPGTLSHRICALAGIPPPRWHWRLL